MKNSWKMSALLPELVTDILLRLPVTSLLRFRCLSRSLCSEIDSEKFVKDHLNRSIQRKTRRKLIFDSLFGGQKDFYFADFEDDLDDAFLLNKPLSYRCSSIYGSCNGLILLGAVVINESNETMDLAVWNPFTRRYKKLPPCAVQIPLAEGGFMSFGLGYDSAHDEHKVVMISDAHDSNHVFFQVWVFELKSYFWRWSRDLEDEVSQSVGCFANGALYWVCERKNKCVGFDLAKEVFFDIPLHPDCDPAAIFLESLVVFGGNLYCPRLLDKTGEYYLLVSDVSDVSDKDGEVVGFSWKKEFTMENVETWCVVPPLPLAYSKDGDSILLGEVYGIFWHNLENKTKQRVNIAALPEFPGYIYDVCWESLVSVGRDSAFDGVAEEVMVDDLEE